jgi:hypothetical protein
LWHSLRSQGKKLNLVREKYNQGIKYEDIFAE